MPTFIADTPVAGGLQSSAEHRLDQAPDGTLWLLLVNGTAAKFFSSKDSGATWSYAGVASDLVLGTDPAEAVYPSMFIDVLGNCHVSFSSYVSNPQMLTYAYGVPLNGGGWDWTTTTFAAASGRLAARTDIIAFPSDGTTQVFVAYAIHGTVGAAPKTAKLHVSLFGTITLDDAAHGPATTVDAGLYPSVTLEFSHNGDGKTPLASPDVWLASTTRTESKLIRVWRATYSGGVWTWQTPVAMGATTYNVINRLFQITWTGTILMIAAATTGADNRKVQLWHLATPFTAAVSHHQATAMTGTGNLSGGAWSRDPVTDKWYMAFYDEADGDIYSTAYDPATNVWTAWALQVTRGGSSSNQRMASVRSPLYDAVPLVFGEPDVGVTVMHHYHHRMFSLVRTPLSPILVSPVDGAAVDLEAGATFSWRYRPVGPGDTQQAWYFQRNTGMLGITYYWNQAAHVWETSEFWNAGSSQEAHFPAGTWEYGDEWQWGVATRSSAGYDSDVADLFVVTSSSVPTVEITGPTAVVYTDSTPTITWVYTFASPQAEYEVRVTLDDPDVDPDDPLPTVWTSGTVASAESRATSVNVPLVDDTDYIAWVRVVADDDSESVWVAHPFSLSVNAPAGPTVSTNVDVDDEDVPTLSVTVQAEANYTSAAQALGTTGWEARGAGQTVTTKAADVAEGILAGFDLVKTSLAGTAYFLSAEGSPPAADEGQAQPAGPLDFPVVAGEEYTMVGRVLSTVARTAGALIQWYNDDDVAGSATVPDSSSLSTPVATSITGYTVVHVTATAPAGATRVRVGGFVNNAATTDHHYWARLSFHPGDGTTWQPGGFSETMTVRIERSIDLGVTWTTIATDVGVDVYQRAVVPDVLAPTNALISYRAYMDLHVPSLTGSDEVIGSDPGDAETDQIVVAEWILRDAAGRPGDGQSILAIITDHKRNDETPHEVWRPIGRVTPIVDLEQVQLAEGEITIHVPKKRWPATRTLVQRLSPVVMLSPMGNAYTVIFNKRDYEEEIGGAANFTVGYVEVAPMQRKVDE